MENRVGIQGEEGEVRHSTARLEVRARIECGGKRSATVALELF
jgi:hypothetical protein